MSGNGVGQQQGNNHLVDDGDPNRESGPKETGRLSRVPEGRPRLRRQVIERVAIVRFAPCEFLFGEAAVREVSGELERLVEAEGHRELLLNLRGVRYLSGELLEALAGFRKGPGRRDTRVGLCGLDPLIRDLLRASHLDEAFDISADEAEALGLLIP
jgi:anti-sigma B factor antagonist